jgi:hypothetical protein
VPPWTLPVTEPNPFGNEDMDPTYPVEN